MIVNFIFWILAGVVVAGVVLLLLLCAVEYPEENDNN